MQRVSESIVRMSGFRRATHKHDTNGVDVNDSVSTVLKLDVLVLAFLEFLGARRRNNCGRVDYVHRVSLLVVLLRNLIDR